MSNTQLQGGQSGSPVKESSFLNRETSIDEQDGSSANPLEEEAISPPPGKEGIPVRWQH